MSALTALPSFRLHSRSIRYLVVRGVLVTLTEKCVGAVVCALWFGEGVGCLRVAPGVFVVPLPRVLVLGWGVSF